MLKSSIITKSLQQLKMSKGKQFPDAICCSIVKFAVSYRKCGSEAFKIQSRMNNSNSNIFPTVHSLYKSCIRAYSINVEIFTRGQTRISTNPE